MTNYNNLPGVNIKVNDGQMLVTEDNTTNSMLIIGIAKPGSGSKVEVPKGVMFVPNEEVLFENYGRYITDGTLNPIAAEWKVAKENGVTNVFLLGLENLQTETAFKETFLNLHEIVFNDLPDYEFSNIVVAGLYAEDEVKNLTLSDFKEEVYEASTLNDIDGIDVYNVVTGSTPMTATGTTEDTTLTITHEGIEATATLKEEKGNVVNYAKYIEEELQKAIDVKAIDLDVLVELTSQNHIQLLTTEKVEWSGTALSTELNITNPADVQIQGASSVPKMLGDYAEKQTLESGTVVVYIATKPAATTSRADIRKKVNELTSRRNEYSKHVQVIAGPPVGERVPGSLRQHWMSGVTHYAVLVNSLPVQHAPTNQPLPGINNLRYDLSLKQLNELTGNKYVTFRSKNNRIVVVDGVTTAPDISSVEGVTIKSDFTRLTTLRSTSYMVSAIRGVVDPFIGRPNEFPVYNAMNTAIRGVINTAIEKGIIQDAAYSIELGDNLDVAKIDLTILPQFELRKIDVTIGLSLPGGFEPMSQ